MTPSRIAFPAIVASALFLPGSACASFLSGGALDTAANVISWVVILVVPVVAIVLFWLVHILPEKVAEKRHHPQKDAIKTLCMLSLFFGGLLWPFAWLWAYSRPVAYKMAYGTDLHVDYFRELAERARAGHADHHEIAHAREELASMDAAGSLTPELRALRPELEELQARAHAAQEKIEIAMPGLAKGA